MAVISFEQFVEEEFGPLGGVYDAGPPPHWDELQRRLYYEHLLNALPATVETLEELGAYFPHLASASLDALFYNLGRVVRYEVAAPCVVVRCLCTELAWWPDARQVDWAWQPSTVPQHARLRCDYRKEANLYAATQWGETLVSSLPGQHTVRFLGLGPTVSQQFAYDYQFYVAARLRRPLAEFVADPADPALPSLEPELVEVYTRPARVRAVWSATPTVQRRCVHYCAACGGWLVPGVTEPGWGLRCACCDLAWPEDKMPQAWQIPLPTQVREALKAAYHTVFTRHCHELREQQRRDAVVRVAIAAVEQLATARMTVLGAIKDSRLRADVAARLAVPELLPVPNATEPSAARALLFHPDDALDL